MTDTRAIKRFQPTSFGDVAYLEVGDPGKPPVLLVHGIPTSSYLWRHVLRFLQNDFHCYAPDLLGLGDSAVDPKADVFHMDAQAEMLEELMASLGHDSFSVVCHDQGGAAAQILAAGRPHKVDCLVLTDCVCYDNWPVPVVARFQHLVRLPVISELAMRAGLVDLFLRGTSRSALPRGVYDPAKMTAEAMEEYLRPLHESPASRGRFLAFLLAGSPRYTLAAAPGLRRFDRPTLVLWAADDRYISPSWGKKLAEEIPGTEGFELIPFCGHFWQEERPAEFTSRIGEFLARHAREPSPARSEDPALDRAG